MKIHAAVLTCSALAGLLALSVPALGQQGQPKTVRACVDEWRANRAAFQAQGITERAFVAQCRGSAATQPATPPAAAARPATQPAPPPAAAARPTTPTTTTTTNTPSRLPPSARAAVPGANQLSTEAQARGRCGPDNVVWANLGSRIYHFPGSREFGRTKRGAFMCERESVAQGMRAAKNERHP